LGGKREVVRVVYDKRYLALPGSWLQKNLRGRVSYQWRDEDGNGMPEQVYAYDYDALGNVANLYVYVEDLKGFGGSNGWKRMRYEYDLVSKKVKYLGYQEGQADQWLHKYRYDGMNRLVEVQTSRDGWYWERDAWYKYYLHRVLGRVMLGERLVQGLDKVYTINGWVKGENAWRLDSVLDLGQDGRMGGLYQYVAKDVMGYELKYFSGDYKAVGLYNTNSFSNFVSLYNGNIGMSVLQQDTMEVMSRRYRYDALNRLKSVDALMGVGFTAFNGYRERFSYDRDGNIVRLTRYAKASVMDSLKYNYYAGNNRLEYVNDVVSATTFTNDIDNQSLANYKYDKTGNLIEDVSENTRIHWTYHNKVKQIDSMKLTPPKYGLVWATKLRMKYDALGNRVVKENPKHKVKEVYVRDAQGNILALYQVKNDSLYTKEFYMYGSQRLGYLEDDVFMGRKCISKWCNVLTPVLPMFPSTLSSSVSVVFGKKRYELSDWLGNVRVVINDRKTPVNIGATTVGYEAQVINVNDYYSYGSTINERTYDYSSTKFRFAFNGKELDNEVYGFGNFQDYGARMYNTRLGRFISPDPLIVGQKKYAWLSGYQFAGDMPTKFIDMDGLEPGYYDKNRWVTQGDVLQRNPTSEEVKKITEQYGMGIPKQGPIEKFIEGTISSQITFYTSIFLPIVNQVYTISKEGIHPGRARDPNNELKWAVPYKLENWNLVPLKNDLGETFEGKEGYERGGKEIVESTIDAVTKMDKFTKSWIKDKVLEIVITSSTTKIINSITDYRNKNSINNSKDKQEENNNKDVKNK
jgi:RHS repeat-associated protein